MKITSINTGRCIDCNRHVEVVRATTEEGSRKIYRVGCLCPDGQKTYPEEVAAQVADYYNCHERLGGAA